MRIAVIGAGVIGITTAAELAQRGHDVHVFERRDSVAAGTSFAHGGLASPALCDWAGASVLQPGGAPAFRTESSGRINGSFGTKWRHRAWLKQWETRHKDAHHGERSACLTALAQGSLQAMQRWLRVLGPQQQRTDGVLLALRSKDAAQQTQQQSEMWQQHGLSVRGLTAQAALDVEAALGGEPDGTDTLPAGLVAAVHLPDEHVGVGRQFVQQLREWSEAEDGLQVHFGVRVRNIHPATANEPVRLHLERGPGNDTLDKPPRSTPPQAAFVHTQAEPQDWIEPFDAVVLCTGADTLGLTRPLGLDLPMVSVWGHSVTFRLRDHATPIRSAVVDPIAGVTLSRQGDRLRACGGFDLDPPPMSEGRPTPSDDTLAPLYAAVDRWFPSAVQRQTVQTWSAPRPMLPDGLPAIGPSGHTGLWLNTGHGGLGWTLACGSAQLLARWITQGGDEAATDTREAARWLSPTRWNRTA